MKKLLQLIFIVTLPFITQAQVINGSCNEALTIPVNNGFIAEQSISGSFAQADMTTDLIECYGDMSTPHHEAWYEFTVTNSRHILNISSDDISPSEYGFTIYKGECGNFTEHLCQGFGYNYINDFVIGQTYKLHLYIFKENVNLTLSILTPSLIKTNYTQYTNEQLVTDVLINSLCLDINNINTKTGFGTAQNGISYFEKGNSTFPFQKGILLSTGNASNASYHPYHTSGDAPWPGDPDLETVFSPDFISVNASSIEFDFIPQIDYISFDYIFASDEYGQFQCHFADAFAFLLTDLTTGETKNLAVIPNTNTPVSVVTIRDTQYNTECESVNIQYFGEYNLVGLTYPYTSAKATAPIGFAGNTVPLTAESAVIPGHQYHIKLVIADRGDSNYDSAVFIDTGSFNIGNADSNYVKISSTNGNILCDDATTTLSVNLNDTFSFTWLKDGIEIPNANTNGLTVNESANYTVKVTLPNAPECSLEFNTNIFISTENSAEQIAASDFIIFETGSDGIYPFDLTAKTEQILAQTEGDEFIVNYHSSQEDADNNINPLPIVYSNIANPQTIYARIKSSMSPCFTTSSFRLVVLDETYTTPAPTGSSTQTFEPGDTLEDIELEGEDIQWYDNPGEETDFIFTPKNGELPLPLTTLLVNGTTYYASQTIYGIESTNRLAVTVLKTLGINDNQFTGMTYYPNPIKDVLTIVNNNDIETVNIVNMLGQTILNKQINNTTAQIDLSSLQSGVYLVNITSGGKSKTLKIIKE